MRRDPRGFPDRRSVSGNAGNGAETAGALRHGRSDCGYAAATLAVPSSRWQWALLPLVVVMLGGMALAFLGETPGLRSAGLGIFVGGAAGYVAVRIVLLVGKRPR